MSEVLKIDADLPTHRTFVIFKNIEGPCLVITPDKAASDAKNLREAASLLKDEGRPKLVAEWLLGLAQKFEEPQST